MKLVIANGSVEVVAINPMARSISMLITMPCTPAQLHSEEAKVRILHKANFAFWYLQQEGFLPDDKGGWLFHLGSIAKPI